MSHFSRRQMLGGVLAATTAAPFISGPARAQTSAYPPRTYPRRVVDLVNDSLVIDMLHPIKIDGAPAPMTEKLAAEYRTSGITAIHHGVGLAGPDARDLVLSFYVLWGHYVQVNSHVLTGVDKMADILRAKRDGKVAVIMGMQNSEHFLKREDVKFFHDLGQRASQLTYNSQTRIGSGSTERVDGGVSDYGVSIIEEMNKVGMLIDVSHCGDRTTLEAIEISPKPIAITHSNCRALNNHPRLKTDEAIKACAAKGGVIGIAGVRNFVTKFEPTKLPDMVDHIDHAVKLVGIDHVGIGSDLDLHGYDDMPPEIKKAMIASLKSSYAFRDKLDTDGFDHPRRILRPYRGTAPPQLFEGQYQGDSRRQFSKIADGDLGRLTRRPRHTMSNRSKRLSVGISRRKMLGGALATAAAAPLISRPVRAQTAAYPPRRYPRQVVDLIRESLVIDMLHPIKTGGVPAPMTEQMAADFRACGITGMHYGVGIGGPAARDQVLAYYTLWGHYISVNSHLFTGVDTMADILRAKRDGKIAMIRGMQNSEHFLKAEDVKFFHDLGQRVSQLTYNWQTRIGSGSTERVDGGVSDFGVTIIQEMNKVGMLIDVSHCGDRTTLDAIDISPRPIAITHSNCRALNDHPRLKTDEAIKACAAKGGVMGIAGVRNFVSQKEPTVLADMVDHIEHAVKLVGIDHVGIGSDFDLNGYDDMPPELKKAMIGSLKSSYAFRDKLDTDGYDHPLRIFDLTEELLRRGYSRDNVKAILGGNFQRLLTATWGG